MMQSVERYMKQAIVDKLASVASAALTSSVHLMRQGPEVVKRWVNEVQEAVNNDNIMVQYHALGLLYQIRRSDKHAIRKLILKFSKAGLRSPYAYCFLVSRIILSLISFLRIYSSRFALQLVLLMKKAKGKEIRY
jgi:coatomer protein complex subunit gamma